MSQQKYIGMDVHQATISVAVIDAGGKLIMECLLQTKADTIVAAWPPQNTDRLGRRQP